MGNHLQKETCPGCGGMFIAKSNKTECPFCTDTTAPEYTVECRAKMLYEAYLGGAEGFNQEDWKLIDKHIGLGCA